MILSFGVVSTEQVVTSTEVLKCAPELFASTRERRADYIKQQKRFTISEASLDSMRQSIMPTH
jgi:hypothetical protein